MNKLVLATRKYKAGYEIRDELSNVSNADFHAEVIDYGKGDKAETEALVDWINHNKDKVVIVKSAYTPNGHYIGNPRMAYLLIVKYGIKPELADPTNNICSIGFCEREHKWYGWSHRAIFGFGIGSVVKEGDCTASSGWTDEYLAEHPEDDTSLPIGFEAKDLIDAKRMAMAFASSVS